MSLLTHGTACFLTIALLITTDNVGYSAENANAIQDGLYGAAESGDIKEMATSIAQGAGILKSDSDGWTALHFAALGGHKEAVAYLLKEGANVNAVTNKGETILMTAVASGSKEVVQFLLERGADPRARTASNVTAAAFAKQLGYVEIEAMVEDRSSRGGRKVQIPSKPIGNPDTISLENGLTLTDWLKAAAPRIYSGNSEQVFLECAAYLQKYGPHKELMKTMGWAATRLAQGIDPPSEKNVYATIDSLNHWIAVGGEWPDLLLTLGDAYKQSGDSGSAKVILGKWLKLVPADHPQRSKIATWILYGTGDPFFRWGGTLVPNGVPRSSRMDCLDCHNVSRKLTGPSWSQVAVRYKREEYLPAEVRSERFQAALGYLAVKVVRGGSGVWGSVPCPPHEPSLEGPIRRQLASILLEEFKYK